MEIKNNGVDTYYSCFGSSKEPKKQERLVNMPFSQTSHKTLYIQSIQEFLVVFKMESGGMIFADQIQEERNFFHKVQSSLDLPSLASKNWTYTQFSVCKNYGSWAHVDQDFFVLYLSCLSGEHEHYEEILYVFCYPEYKTVIPMESGDLVIFNPLKFHCRCTPWFEGKGRTWSQISPCTQRVQKKISIYKQVNTKSQH